MIYLVSTGAGSLVEISYREICELRNQGLVIVIAGTINTKGNK